MLGKWKAVCAALCVFVVALWAEAQSKGKELNAFEQQRSVRVTGIVNTVQEPSGPTVFQDYQRVGVRAEHPFSELNQLSYKELVDLLVTIEWDDIPGLFSFSDDSYEFFADSTRYMYMINALDERAKAFDGTDPLGIPTLVEVLRAGSYLAWSNNELEYLKQNGEFVQKLAIPIVSMASNSALSWDDPEALEVMQALGYCMGVGVCTPEIVTTVAPVVEKFAAKQETYLQNDRARRAMYQIGAGINHGLINVELYANKQKATEEFNPVIGPLLIAYLSMAKYGSMGDDYLYIINNAVWWYGNCGLVTTDHQTIVDNLMDIIDLYGKWEAPSLEALKLLTDQTKPYKDLNSLDVEAVKDELKAKLLPKFYRFDDGEFIFRCGADVTEKKVKQLYWALKEVRSQFLRYSMIHDPLESGKADDSLTAIIYNSPDEYDNNNFLWGLSTNNGGMYIESWGTFFTYERTPDQSIYTLEDLFRHELTHYLQGRFQTKGDWGQGIYANDRLTWFEEGGAEFTAGSSRLGGIKTRLNMVEGLERNGAALMDLNDVLTATYSSGFTFYTYSFALFHYLHKYDPETLFALIKACNAADANAYDAIIAKMKSNATLASEFEKFKVALVDSINTFQNIAVNDDYFKVQATKKISEVLSDISSVVTLGSASNTTMYSEYFNTYRVRGMVTPFEAVDTISDWKKMDSVVNDYLMQLAEMEWEGYKTTTCYFANYRNVRGMAEFDVTFEGILNPGVSITKGSSVLAKNAIEITQTSRSVTINGKGRQLKGGIYSITGRELMPIEYSGLSPHVCNLTDLPQGVYFLKISYESGMLVQKIAVP